MKGHIKKIAMLALIALLTFGSSMSAFAASVPPSYIGGNDPKTGTYEHYTRMKVPSPISDSYTDNVLTVDIVFSEDQKSVVSFSSNLPIRYVFVKGGDGGNMYSYPDGTYQDTNLIPPINNGGQDPTISHVTFYYKIKGTLKIVKEVIGSPSEQSVFYFEVKGPNGYYREVSITGSGELTLAYLDYGFYNVEEVDIPPYYTVDHEEEMEE